MSKGARFVLNSRYFHIAQPGESHSQYAMLGSHMSNLVEYAGTRETVALNFDDVTAEQPSTDEQKTAIDKLSRMAGLKNHKIDDVLEYNDYKEAPTVKNASQLIAYLAEQALIHGSFDEVSNLVEYAAERPGVVKVGEHGLFSATKSVDLEEAKKELSNHQGNIYTHVLSLRREDADRLGYDSQEPWRNLILSKIDVIAQAHNIELSNLHWYAAMHNTGHHPHVHLFVYADEAASQKPHLNKEGLKLMKSALATEIFREEMHNSYVVKTEYRNELNKQSKELLNALINNPLDYYENEQLNELINKINQLANTIPETGKMVYGYMPKDVKNLVDDIQSHLVYDNKILNDLYMQYCNCQYNIEQMYINEPKFAPVDTVEAFKPIKNEIIRKAVEIKNGVEASFVQSFSDNHINTDNITSQEGRTEPSDDVLMPPRNLSIESPDYNNANDNYKHSKFRKHLHYNYLAKSIPLIKEYQLDGDYNKKTFKALKILSEDINLRTGETCRELADCYFYGKGCERDINEAFMWYGIAADQFKDSYAEYRLGQIYYNGTDEIAINTELGKYYSYAAYSHFVGEVENSDFFYALENNKNDMYYIDNVSADDAYKEYLIGRLYLKGFGVELDYGKALNSFLLSAENGYGHANYYIGNMWYYGLGFEKDYSEALTYYDKAAKQGDSYANYRLGKMYLKGEGVSVDVHEAARCFKKSKDRVVLANYDLARLYESYREIFSESQEEIFSLYKKALEGLTEQEKEIHDTFTEIRLGNMYLNGQGTQVDIDKAIEWLNKAAEQDNADALYQLGYIYSNEEYSCFDTEKAYDYYARALDSYIRAEGENSNATAEYRIGRMYINGMGTERNLEEGVKWLEQAALNNNGEAAYQLYNLYSKGEGIEANPERAMKFLEIACYLENPYAQYALGKVNLENGNLEEGVKWLESAADKEMPYASYRLGAVYSSDEYNVRDDELAQQHYNKALKLFISAYDNQPDDMLAYQVGRMYLSGQGAEADIQEAVAWFNKAAEQDNADALYQLGYIYSNEEYSVVDKAASNRCFLSAYEIYLNTLEVNPNNSEAAYKLGTMYHYGLGVEQDINKAIEYYKKSAELGNKRAQQKLDDMENQNQLTALSIASVAAHFGRIIDTETHAAFKQRYTNDSKLLRQEKIQKINSGQAVDDYAQAPDY